MSEALGLAIIVALLLVALAVLVWWANRDFTPEKLGCGCPIAWKLMPTEVPSGKPGQVLAADWERVVQHRCGR